MPSTYSSSVLSYYKHNLSFILLFLYSFCTQWEGARKCFSFVKGHFHLSFLMHVFPYNVLLHNFNFQWNLCMMLFKNTLFYAREKGMAPHSSILAWRIPWTEELAGFSPWGYKESDTTVWPPPLSMLSIQCSQVWSSRSLMFLFSV